MDIVLANGVGFRCLCATTLSLNSQQQIFDSADTYPQKIANLKLKKKKRKKKVEAKKLHFAVLN